MSRFPCFLLLLAVLAMAGCASRGPSGSNVTVRTAGDAQVYGVFTSGRIVSGGR